MIRVCQCFHRNTRHVRTPLKGAPNNIIYKIHTDLKKCICNDKICSCHTTRFLGVGGGGKKCKTLHVSYDCELMRQPLTPVNPICVYLPTMTVCLNPN